jgi:preprotein translocase subunit SecG
MLHTIILVAHVLIAALIVGLVLLQRGKGADAGTGFGAGASGTVFGARGSATFFSRATAVLATLFFVTSLALAYLSTQRTAPTSLLESGSAAPTSQPAPANSPPPATSSPPPATSAPPAGELPTLPSEPAPEPPNEKN